MAWRYALANAPFVEELVWRPAAVEPDQETRQFCGCLARQRRGLDEAGPSACVDVFGGPVRSSSGGELV